MRISDWSSDVCSSDLHEDPARLPMALFEVLQHCLKLLARGMLLHPKHFVDETSGPTGGDLLRLPGNMKRANDYPRGISVQAKTMVMDIQQRRGPRIVLPSHLRLRQRLRGYVPRPPALGKDAKLHKRPIATLEWILRPDFG